MNRTAPCPALNGRGTSIAPPAAMTFFADLLAAVRQSCRRPAMPAVTVAFLGAGMGIVAGVFAVADVLLWRQLPLPDAARLVWVQSLDRGVAGDSSAGLVQAWTERTRTLDAIGTLRPAQATWRDRAGTDRLDGNRMAAAAFTALGLLAERGRGLRLDDEQPGAAPVVVLTQRLWRARFAAADVIGESVDLDGRSATIVGVLSADADALPFVGEWLAPLSATIGSPVTGARYLDVVGRLAPGAAPPDAERELSALAHSAGAVGDDGSPLGARVQRLSDAFNRDAARVLQPLLAATLLVLLIAMVNTANLRLAEQQRRQAEISLRAALGAGRRRLIGQLLGEAAVVALGAAVLALLLAEWCIAGLVAVMPADVVRDTAIHVDGRVALFTALLAVAVMMTTGLIPALRHTRGELALGVRSQARGLISGDDRLRRGFVVAQIALAMTLGTAGAIMLQSTQRLGDAAGISRESDVWTAAIRLGRDEHPGVAEIAAVVDRIVEGVAAVPGVERAAVASRVLLAGGAPGSDVALAHDVFTPGSDRQVRIRFVTPGYFTAAGAPVLQGRDIDAADRAGAEPVVLVNETLAARLAPNRSPIGEAIKFAVQDFNGPTPTSWRIVGLVADAHDRGPRQPAEPEVYVSLAQGPAGAFEWIGRQLLLIVRPATGSRLSPATLRAAINGAAPTVPAFDMQTLAARFQRHIATERLLTGLLLPLAGAGLLLAGFGVFAVAMHTVQQRRREIALRMVLGATPGEVMRDLGRAAAVLASLGMAAGIAGAAASGSLLRTVSFGAEPLDASVLGVVLFAVALTTAIAMWLPARRASQNDPASVLRAE